ncbi:MAG: hypothetical protein ABEN55_10800 [Bradymonadaceae bacterium]
MATRYWLAFLAGPALNVVSVPGAEFVFGVIEWMVTLVAFPVYWIRVVQPDGGTGAS